MNRATRISMVLVACLALTAGCGGDGSDSTAPIVTQPSLGTQPSFITQVHSASETSTLPPGAPQSTAHLSLTVSGTKTLLLAAWHAEFDGGFPDSWTVTSNGVPGTLIV